MCLTICDTAFLSSSPVLFPDDDDEEDIGTEVELIIGMLVVRFDRNCINEKVSSRGKP